MTSNFHPTVKPAGRRGRRLGAAGRSLLLLALGAGLGPAWSADALTEDVQQAYAPYRVALFRTNGGSAAEARVALDEARKAWQAVQARYATQAPSPYDRDPRRAETLSEVADIYARAARQVEEAQLAEAHETLEAVRDRLADLRHRNGTVTFSDAMNAYHAQMERLLKEAPAQLEVADRRMDLVAQTGVLAYLAARLSAEASESLRRTPEFAAQLKAVEESVTRLQSALHAGRVEAAREALGRLKKPYSQLFLKFG